MSTDNDTPRTITIQLTKGFVAIVDEQDADLALLKWCIISDRRGHEYARRTHYNADGTHKTVMLHRLIMEKSLGRPLKKSEVIDHKDGNGLNNSRSNLRLATDADNARNSQKPRHSKRKYKGVDSREGNRHLVNICVDRQHIYLGKYATEEIAGSVYNYYATQYFGEFANLNPIENWQALAEKGLAERTDLKSDNKSGYTGVSARKDGRWQAYCYIDKRQVYLGLFETPELAQKARREYLKANQ